ncbi:MAG: cytochrome c [Acidobacteria bacterium]|nr:MAG: cytochrome c [Acidobacteriota bacterium]
MPPFPGTDAEREALAFYLARLGGAPSTLPAAPVTASPAKPYFDEQCSACHGQGADFPIGGRGRTAAQLYEMLGRLPQVNEMMPPFEGPDELRRALADYLASLPAARTATGGAR